MLEIIKKLRIVLNNKIFFIIEIISNILNFDF